MEDDPQTQSAAFWDDRYRSGKTPWDFGGVPEELRRFMAEKGALGRILVPGCGSGYEVRAFMEAGNQVLGIDLSSEALARAEAVVGSSNSDALRQGDFFKMAFPEAPFDGIYERTFLCALPPTLRPAYLETVHRLLKPNGRLFGYFLYGDEPDPPPHPMDPAEEKTAFQEHFDLLASFPSKDPLPLFEGMERWQVWKARA